MCECNCGDFKPYKAYRVGELVLVVEIYWGCKSCNNPLDFALHIMTPEYAKEWDIDAAALPEFLPDRHGHDQRYFPIIGQEDIIEWAEKEAPEISPYFYGSLANYLREHGLNLLQGGMEIRLDKAKKTEDKS